mgnify:FL=1|jgi:hypothetical protein|tara:strand:- start:353 stop:568 length:216 start_codon:yes stop_codon:yes gene_type:complete
MIEDYNQEFEKIIDFNDLEYLEDFDSLNPEEFVLPAVIFIPKIIDNNVMYTSIPVDVNLVESFLIWITTEE